MTSKSSSPQSAALALAIASVLSNAAYAQQTTAQQTTAQPTTTQQTTTVLEEVVVTGTSIRGVAPTGAAVIEVTTEDIESIGVANTAQLMAKIPQFSSFLTLPTTISPLIGVTVQVQLRNLPTLVLLDGQRQVSDSANTSQFNINSIPQGAIERIEIVPDGGSAVYGSDAIGGVVNVITRRNFNGADFSVRYGVGQADYNVFDASGTLGKTWDSGSALISVLYNKTDPFLAKDVSARVLNQTYRGGQDLRATSCFQPNLRTGTGTATVTYAPPNYAPGTSRCDNVGNSTLTGASENRAFLANFHQDLGESIHVFFSGRYTEITTIDYAPAPSTSTLVIAPGNPYFIQPPGSTGAVTALYNTANLWGANGPRSDGLGVTKGMYGGIEYKFGTWRAVGTYNYSKGLGNAESQGNNNTALSAAAAGTTAATALDPFGYRTSEATLAAIKNQHTIFRAEYGLQQGILRLDGPLLALSGGEIKAALGVEAQKQTYDGYSLSAPYNTGYPSYGNGKRDVNSVYGEVLVPLFSDANGLPGLRSLRLSAAIRYDDYSTFGSTTNPKLGFDWRPIQDLNIRGNYGTSFIAPVLTDTNASDTRAIYTPGNATLPPNDPRLAASTPQIQLAGGNPNLRPQTSETYSVGFDYTPSWLEGFRANATYYDVLFEDRIGLAPGGVQVYTDPIYAAIPIAIARASTAQVQAVIDNFSQLINFPTSPPNAAAIANGTNGVVILDSRRQNLSSQKQQGLDLALDYSWNTGIGSFDASLSGNYVFTLQNATGSGAPFLDDITRVPFRVRAGLNYSAGPVRATVAVNHIDEQAQTYSDSAAATQTYVMASYSTLDLSAIYRLESLHSELSLTVNNALDAGPPFAYGGTGYRGVDPLGRVVYGGVRVSF